MMDAHELFPEGHHPVFINRTPTGEERARYLSRSNASIRYYYIDFELSSYWPPESTGPRLVTTFLGRERDLPEFASVAPYDPFKLDIRILGLLFRKEIYNVSVILQTDDNVDTTDAEILEC